jgi:hypothetical protein
LVVVGVVAVLVARLCAVLILIAVVMDVMVFLEEGCAASLALGMDVMHTVEAFLSTIVV